jgi:hypothetical protein
MDFPIEIKLQYPITIGDERIEALTIKRRAKAKDLKAMDGISGEIGKSAALLAQLADVPVSYIDQMDAADFTRAAAVVADFL